MVLSNIMNYEKSEQILILVLETLTILLKNTKKLRALVRKKAKQVREQLNEQL